MDYLKRFHEEYPEVHIKVINRTSIGCVELLESGQVDFIVINYPNLHLDPRARLQTVREFHDVFVANAQYFPIENQEFSLEELLKYPILMLSPKSTTSEYLHQLFQASGLKLQPEVELSSNDLLLDLARIGLGITCVPDYMLKEQENLIPIRLKETLPARSLVLASQERSPQTTAVQKFMEYFL